MFKKDDMTEQGELKPILLSTYQYVLTEQWLNKLTNVKMLSDCVIKATLDHPNFFMAAVIPSTISASLDTVLRNSGNSLLLERRGDEDPADIYKHICLFIS